MREESTYTHKMLFYRTEDFDIELICILPDIIVIHIAL